MIGFNISMTIQCSMDSMEINSNAKVRYRDLLFAHDRKRSLHDLKLVQVHHRVTVDDAEDV